MARFYQFQYHFIKQRLAVPLRFFSRTRDNVDRWYIRVIKATHYHGQYSINQYSNHNNIERLNRLHCVRDTCHCLNIFQRGNYVDSQEIRIAKFMSQRWITFETHTNHAIFLIFIIVEKFQSQLTHYRSKWGP